MATADISLADLFRNSPAPSLSRAERETLELRRMANEASVLAAGACAQAAAAERQASVALVNDDEQTAINAALAAAQAAYLAAKAWEREIFILRDVAALAFRICAEEQANGRALGPCDSWLGTGPTVSEGYAHRARAASHRASKCLDLIRRRRFNRRLAQVA